MLARALGLSTSRVDLDMQVPMDAALLAMTKDEFIHLELGQKLNANMFPPMQRLLHHMMTTIVYPKGGSHDEVTTVNRFLFYCMFNSIPINLPDLMLRLIE